MQLEGSQHLCGFRRPKVLGDLDPWLDPRSMQHNGQEPLKRSPTAILLHTCGVQVGLIQAKHRSGRTRSQSSLAVRSRTRLAMNGRSQALGSLKHQMNHMIEAIYRTSCYNLNMPYNMGPYTPLKVILKSSRNGALQRLKPNSMRAAASFALQLK